MDGTEYGIAIIASFIIVALLYVGLNEAYGYDYISPYGSLWIYEPSVCLDRTTNPELSFYAFQAISSWKDTMNAYGYHNFNYTIYGIYDLEDSNHCNIMVRFGEPQRLGSSDIAIGVAACNQDIPIMIGCEIVVKVPHRDWYGTLVHEVGHSFGLGHKNSFNATDFPAIILGNDVMFKQTGFKRVITIDNVNFLIDHYGEDGWNMPNNLPQNFTIYHPEEYEIQNRHRY